MKSLLSICGTVLVLSVMTFAQGTVDERGVYHPTEEEIAARRRREELLRHPTFITLRLLSSPRDVPREAATDTPAPSKVKDYMGFQLLVTQNSPEAMQFGIKTPYYEYRPELMSAGEVVAYSQKAEELVKRAESHPHSGSVISITLKAGVENRYDFINLDDWYEPLNPGRYQLIVRKQFAWGGDWVVSNPVYFEVIPRTPGSPIPAGVTIELTPEGVPPRTDAKPYQLGSEVVITLLVRNKSDQPLRINVIDREYGNRPLLFKNGTLVPYLEDATALIKSKEENPRLVSVVNDFFLDPQVGTWPDGFDLKKWYGQLSPGSYRLVIRHRFEIDGPWTAESAPLLFEVVPSKKN
jgi:hypothetical protein